MSESKPTDDMAGPRPRPAQGRGAAWLPRPVRRRLESAALAAAKGTIRIYQLTLSPLIGHQCRFYPSCSNYALAALAAHGPLKGAWLALRRLLRCHPFHAGGVDLPPPAPGKAS